MSVSFNDTPFDMCLNVFEYCSNTTPACFVINLCDICVTFPSSSAVSGEICWSWDCAPKGIKSNLSGRTNNSQNIWDNAENRSDCQTSKQTTVKRASNLLHWINNFKVICQTILQPGVKRLHTNMRQIQRILQGHAQFITDVTLPWYNNIDLITRQSLQAKGMNMMKNDFQ